MTVKELKVTQPAAAAQEIKFMEVYRMEQLKGMAYYTALRSMVDYFEWSNGREPQHIGEVIRWVEREDILFHAEGDMVGGDDNE